MIDARIRTPAEGRRLLRRYQREALPIRRAGFLPLKGLWFPLLELDAARRPDVADLARIHRSEGAGDTEVTCDGIVTSETVYARVDLALLRPVTCRFSLLFDVRQHFDWLALVARLLVTTAATLDDAIGWDLDTTTLTATLALASLMALAKEGRRHRE